jgi:uncharacterized membrane protein
MSSPEYARLRDGDNERTDGARASAAPDDGAEPAVPAGDDGDGTSESTLLKTRRGDVVDATPLVRRVEHGLRVVQATVEHQGPLPPPEDLQRYDQVMPGLADRIVSMAEREQMHRHAMQEVSVRGGLDIAKRGQLLGFAIAIIVLGVALALVLLGHETAGTVIASVDLASLAAVFAVGRQQAAAAERKRRPSSDEKKKEASGGNKKAIPPA